MHRTCSSQDMIAMKESGFLPGQIESSCTTWGFDAAAVQTLSKSVATGMNAWAELEKARRSSALGFNAGAGETLSSSVATGMKVWEELEKAKREAANK
jgi:hypothetical protein